MQISHFQLQTNSFRINYENYDKIYKDEYINVYIYNHNNTITTKYCSYRVVKAETSRGHATEASSQDITVLQHSQSGHLHVVMSRPLLRGTSYY